MSVVVTKLLISLLCSGLIALLLRFQTTFKLFLNGQSEGIVLTASVLMLRMLPFLVVFVGLNYDPLSDVNGFFAQAEHAALGEVVYRDFYCMYSPVFPYLNGAILLLWHSPKAIVLVMILMEALAVWLTNRFYQTHFSPTERLFKSILYLLTPGALVLCVLGAQEDVWMWLLGISAWLIWQKTGRIEWAGVMLLLGFLFTKAVFILFFPALLFLLPRPIRWIWPMVVLGAVAFGVLYYYTGWEFINQPTREADTLRAPNLLSVLNPWVFDGIGVGLKFWNWIGLLTTVGMGVWFVHSTAEPSPVSDSVAHITARFSGLWVVLFGTMMVVQQSAYSNYLFIFLLPLTFYWLNWSNPKEVTIFLLFNVLCVVQPSLWWRLRMPHYHTPTAIFDNPPYTFDYAMQVGIVVGTLYFVRLVWKKSSTVTNP